MSFSRIFKSSAMLGVAQVAALAAAFVRSKIIAVCLGPVGIGLVGVMTAFNGNMSAVASWGLGTSGVRLISGAEGESRRRKQAAVRRFGFILSAIGLLLTLLTFWPVAMATFNDGAYMVELLIAGMSVPCMVASTTWSSLLQADGQVKSLAKVQLSSALLGLALGAPLIVLWGSVGVACSMLLAAAVPAISTWWVARRSCPPSHIDEHPDDLKTMVRLGGGLVIVGLASQIAAYVVRLIIIRHYSALGQDGLEASGYYQAAIAIAGSLPAVVFGAMGTDFFPRVAAAKNETEAQALSEKQIQAGLLLALPILTLLLSMGEVGVRILYDERFDRAIPLLSWMIWGVFIRLLAWPLGYWMLARGSVQTVVVVESTCNLAMALLPLALVPEFGVEGAAYAFSISYVMYACVMLAVSKARSGAWITFKTLSWFGIGTLWLASVQLGSKLGGGGWWGIIPTLTISGLCTYVYRREVRQENLNQNAGI
jgi:PST family polysaccharide transporter